MIYSIPTDSPLGQRLDEHFAAVNAANKAADEFARSLHERFLFPALTEGDILHFSPDCEGGGLLGIQLADPSALYAINHSEILWQSIQLPDGKDPSAATLFFPRIERHSLYLRYAVAARLIRDANPAWSFIPPTREEEARGALCHREEFDRVRRRVTPDNLKRLTDKRGNTPNPQTRVTLGHHYVYGVDDIDESLRQSFHRAPDTRAIFPLAKELHDAWMALPTVPSGRLLSILRPTTTELIKHPRLEWRKEHDAYIIDTNLELPNDPSIRNS